MFSKKIWEETYPIYKAIIEHPFIQGLTNGTLPREAFVEYLQQDVLYLKDYSRALALLATRAESTETMQMFLKHAHNALFCETQIHNHYLTLYKSSPTNEKNLACLAYTEFLMATTATRSYEEAVASILPCFWIYREVGNHVFASMSLDNPYSVWIQNYAGEEFAKAVDEAINYTDSLYENASISQQTKMHEKFLRSSYLEYLFWDNPYFPEKYTSIHQLMTPFQEVST